MKIGDKVKDNNGKQFKLAGDGFTDKNWYLCGEDSLESKSISFIKNNYTLVYSCPEGKITPKCLFS